MSRREPFPLCDCRHCEDRRRRDNWLDVAKGAAMILAFIALVVLMVGGWQ